MNTNKWLQEIRSEIRRLEKLERALTGSNPSGRKRKRKLSGAGRRAIVAAQKARWAKTKKA